MIVPSDYISQHQTERLTMVPLTTDHIKPWVNFLRDENAVRYYPERGINPEESAEMWINAQLSRYREGRFGLLALYNENEFIGQCGLITQDLHGEIVLEIGYHLFPEFQGNGYASEAAIWFKEYAFKNSITNRVVSFIHPENHLSQAVARRNGMQPWKEISWNGKDVIVYAVEDL